LYFHGGADSRLEARLLAEQAANTGVRLIGIDRPGMGLSQFKEGRRLLDWPDDVVELAEHLHIDRFAVVGVSGGGPYALACAYKIPNRLTSCGVIAGEWHHDGWSTRFSQWRPWLVMPILRRYFRDTEHASASLLRFTQKWPEPDRKCLALPDIRGILAASIVAAFCQGARGTAYDGMLVQRLWGIGLEDIDFPALYLWHGELDPDVPVVMGRVVAEKLRACNATFYPDEGHISLIVNHREEIVATLMS
jgi:pimeloyl-ACP methyl ester carboxylesterase